MKPFLSLSLIAILSTVPALAKQPPNPPEEERETEIFGSRTECSVTSSTSVFLPAADNRLTISAHPTIVLNSSGATLIVSVSTPNLPQPLWRTNISGEGLREVKIEAQLEPEQPYILTIAEKCGHKLGGFKRVALKHVRANRSLSEKLAGVPTDWERAQILQQAGIGYDALAAAYQASKDLEQFREFLKQL